MISSQKVGQLLLDSALLWSVWWKTPRVLLSRSLATGLVTLPTQLLVPVKVMSSPSSTLSLVTGRCGYRPGLTASCRCSTK